MRKTNGAEKLLVGGPAVTQKCVWVASDGTEFLDKASAEKYEEVLQNPYYKELKTKVEQLERTIEHLQHDLTLSRSIPYQRPQVMLNGQRDTGGGYVS